MRTLLILSLSLAAPAFAAMPAAEQTALVKQYCAVCHTDRANNGGLSLEHYDAAKPDPPLAAMMLSKINNGAMGAAGNGEPDKAAQQAWLQSTIEQSAHATEWFVKREERTVSAAIVREVPLRKPGPPNSPLYQLRVACNAATGAGEMQLTWSPQPQTNRTMTASVDGNAPVEYRIEGLESMGNGAAVKTGRASIVLSSGSDARLSLPRRELTIRDLFGNETVRFPFSELDNVALSGLGKCFRP